MLLRPAVPLTRALCRHARLRLHASRACSGVTLRAGRAVAAAAACRAAPRSLLLLERRAYSSQNLPPHHEVVLPALSPTMESGSIISWEKAEGDHVAEGDLLAEIETDKASMGFENEEAGYLAKILVAAGTKDIPLGKLLCIIVENKDDIDKFKDYVDTATPAAAAAAAASPAATAAPPAPAKPPPAPAAPPSPATATPAALPTGGRVMASPRARRLAAERGIDLTSLQGGSDGLVRAAQVPTSAPAPAASAIQSSAPHDDLQLSDARKAAGQRALLSKQTVPHYCLTIDVDMTQVAQVRADCNARAGVDGVRLGALDFVIKAAALACVQVPAVNSAWMDTFIRQYRSVDVSVAAPTQRGLVAPVVSGAERRGVADIARAVRELAERARADGCQPHEQPAGTFTVADLSMFGVKGVSAIIEPPQACVLAVGGVARRLVPGDDGPRVVDTMTVTLACDHRVVDGAVGAQWLATFKSFMQQPVTMIL